MARSSTERQQVLLHTIDRLYFDIRSTQCFRQWSKVIGIARQDYFSSCSGGDDDAGVKAVVGRTHCEQTAGVPSQRFGR